MASDIALALGQKAEAAILAAAAGDALGWPQENRSARVGGRRGVEPQLDFVEWRRREGGSYAPHEELVPSGAYSDDTQLILAVARSLLRKSEWWSHLTTVELPFWLLYQRGGGGATRRAASSWQKGRPPWTDTKLVAGYFEAGGNGVAMRVLPHAIAHASGDSFESVAHEIVADGIATHGHPRALVGALAYGHAVWFALRQSETLSYGELIESTIAAANEWGRRPSLSETNPTWAEAVASSGRDRYDAVWEKTAEEMLDLLRLAQDGIARGSLAIDRDTLSSLGSTGGPAVGSGTVTAAAAVFLASRYAARPAQGLVAAAFVRGADTDTLASMTGAILGAVNGDEWLGREKERLQDGAYLSVIGRHLVDGVGLAPVEDAVPRLAPAALREFWRELATKDVNAEVVLPDGRLATILNKTEHETRSRTNEITSWLVRTGDSQTLSLKRVTKRAASEPEEATHATAPRYRIGVIIEVNDLDRSLSFYRDVVGLDISRQSPHYVSFAGLLALAPIANPRPGDQRQLSLPAADDAFESHQTITIFLPHDALDLTRSRLERGGTPVSAFAERHGRRTFRCLDPDGNVLEFQELNGG